MWTLFISWHAHCHYWSPNRWPIMAMGNRWHLLQIKWAKRRKNKIFPIKMKINGCSLIYIEAEKVGGIKAVSVENWWGIWKRQRKSADTQIHKYKSQIHKYEDQLMIDEEFGRGGERVQRKWRRCIFCLNAILTPRIRYSYCSCCYSVTEKPG